MPVLYAIDPAGRLVHLVTVGEASFHEWRDALLRVFADPAYRPGFNFISDRRRCEVPSRVFAEQVAALARKHEGELGRCRWAVVTAGLGADDAARAIKCRAGLSDVEAGYFFDLEDARRWLLCGDLTFGEWVLKPSEDSLPADSRASRNFR